MISLFPLDAYRLRWAQCQVTDHHYLHAPVDSRCTVEGYGLYLACTPTPQGCLLFGRPEATRCYPWYGSVEDVASGRAEVTRWQVLNLARVWFSPAVQVGSFASAQYLPGYIDRGGVWRSTLASTVLRLAVARIGYDYLLARPPCFLDEPYELRWLLSYCDTRRHKGTIYRAAGFSLYRTNADGIQTWRIALPALTSEQDAAVRTRSEQNRRSIAYRAKRAAADVQQGVLL